MSLADQVTATYIVVGLLIGFASWLATANRGIGMLLVSLAVSLIGAFGVEIIVSEWFGVYATFGSLETLIPSSAAKSAIGAGFTVAVMRLALLLARAPAAWR